MKGDIGHPTQGDPRVAADEKRRAELVLRADTARLRRQVARDGCVTYRELACERSHVGEAQAVYERARFAQRAQADQQAVKDADMSRPLNHGGSPDIGRGFATEGAHFYVGDDDHAEPYIDRGGRDTREHGDSAKLDAGKLRYDLIPVGPLRELARVYTIGAAKYAPRGWETGMDWSRIIAAMQRHVEAWRDGETLDPVDGQHHLSSVAWCAFALMEFERTHPDLDDRPL